MRRRGPLIVAALLLLGVRIHALLHALDVQAISGDIDRYYAIASAPGVPYRDVPVEYPPVTVLELHALHLIAPTRAAMGHVLVVLTMALEAGSAILLWRGWGRSAALVFLITDSFLIDALCTRIDMLSVLLAVLAVVLWKRRHRASAGVTLVAGVAAKLWPAALLPFLLSRSDRQARLLAGVAGAGAVVTSVWLLLGRGARGIIDVLTFRGAHGWQIESVIGSVLRLAENPRIELEAGAHRFGEVPAGLSPLLLLAAAAVAVYAGIRSASLSAMWVAAVAAFLSASTLLSPQFIVWLLPAAGIAWAERERALVVIVAMVAAPTWILTFTYGELLGGNRGIEFLVVGRNLLLLAALAVALIRIRGSPLS
ncbi:MAG: glycosyltransferase 87 family protein [Candidatus Dormibacteria bacterium]